MCGEESLQKSWVKLKKSLISLEILRFGAIQVILDFLGTFLTPTPLWYFPTFWSLILSLICFELQNKYEKKFILKLNLAIEHKFSLSIALKTKFKKWQKYVWHTVDPPPTLLECHVIFEWPLCTLFSKTAKEINSKDGKKWRGKVS